MFLSSLCYGRRSGDRLFFRIDAGSLLLVATTYVTFARYIINAWKPAICFHRRSVTFRVAPPRRATQRTHCLRRKANISHQSASHWTTPPAAYASQQHVCIAKSMTKIYWHEVFKRSLNSCPMMMNRATDPNTEHSCFMSYNSPRICVVGWLVRRKVRRRYYQHRLHSHNWCHEAIHQFAVSRSTSINRWSEK